MAKKFAAIATDDELRMAVLDLVKKAGPEQLFTTPGCRVFRKDDLISVQLWVVLTEGTEIDGTADGKERKR